MNCGIDGNEVSTKMGVCNAQVAHQDFCNSPLAIKTFVTTFYCYSLLTRLAELLLSLMCLQLSMVMDNHLITTLSLSEAKGLSFNVEWLKSRVIALRDLKKA